MTYSQYERKKNGEISRISSRRGGWITDKNFVLPHVYNLSPEPSELSKNISCCKPLSQTSHREGLHEPEHMRTLISRRTNHTADCYESNVRSASERYGSVGLNSTVKIRRIRGRASVISIIRDPPGNR